MASSHLLRVLRPTCNYRQIYLSRTLPLYTGVFHRCFFSDKPILSLESSTEAPVKKRQKRSETAKPKVARRPKLTEEELDVSIRSLESSTEEPVKKRQKRSETAKSKVARRPKLTEEEELNVSIRSSESSTEEPVKKRRKRSETAKPRTRRPELTEEELNVSKLNLPPIDKWRQYFAIMEGQRLRFFLRNPDTARKLAEAFVPEGSKDLIIIEAASGMRSCFFCEVLVIQPMNRSWAANKSSSQSSKRTNQEIDCPREA